MKLNNIKKIFVITLSLVYLTPCTHGTMTYQQAKNFYKKVKPFTNEQEMLNHIQNDLETLTPKSFSFNFYCLAHHLKYPLIRAEKMHSNDFVSLVKNFPSIIMKEPFDKNYGAIKRNLDKINLRDLSHFISFLEWLPTCYSEDIEEEKDFILSQKEIDPISFSGKIVNHQRKLKLQKITIEKINFLKKKIRELYSQKKGK